MHAGCRMPDAGCRMPDAGCRMPDAGCRMPDAGCRMPDAGRRMLDAGCRTPDAGCRMPDAGRLARARAPAPGTMPLAELPAMMPDENRSEPVSAAQESRSHDAPADASLPGELSLSAARALALAAQGLDRRPRRAARKADVLAAIRRMGALQIDTISVVARSPYLVLWSRLGDYDPAWLDELLAEGALFEYWAHEACFLPIERYALFRHRMIDPGELGWKYSHAWVEEHRADVERVLAHVRQHGSVRSADFRDGDGRSGAWWGWKPEKRALEMLFTAGELMIVRRQAFQRVYDLRERVLPGWDDAALPPAREAARTLALDAVRALGITTARWVADYYRTSKKETPAIVREIAEEGALIPVAVEGWKEPAYIHPDNLELARRAGGGAVRPSLTTFLSPFDPIVWDRVRARALFGFDYRLECYTPAPKRRYGYFSLPILRRGALVGRADARAHRRDGIFEVRSLHLEPRVRPTDRLAADLARALRELAGWHATPEIVLRRTDPPAAAGMITAALGAAPAARLSPGAVFS
jgi:uncharacterized protein YcaQ